MRRSGLGRGLGALIPSELARDAGATLQYVPVDEISTNPFQPRSHFDEEALVSLTNSVRELGVLQPVLIRPSDGHTPYELIAGERRWQAAKRAGLQEIPAIVRTLEDVHALEHALVENLHRQDLNPLEEAAAYQQLVEDFGLTQEQVAQRVGRSRPAVANTLRLLHLAPSIQRLLLDGSLTAGHARALLGVPDRAEQERLASQIVADRLSVREVEALVRRAEAGEGAPAVDEPAARPDRAVPATVGATKPAGLLELERLLADHLDTRVAVHIGKGPGRVVIDFADIEDLERICRRMLPEGHV